MKPSSHARWPSQRAEPSSSRRSVEGYSHLKTNRSLLTRVTSNTLQTVGCRGGDMKVRRSKRTNHGQIAGYFKGDLVTCDKPAQMMSKLMESGCFLSHFSFSNVCLSLDLRRRLRFFSCSCSSWSLSLSSSENRKFVCEACFEDAL